MTVEIDGKQVSVLRTEKFNQFDSSLLDLGNISKKSVPTDAIAAVFDLEGFTRFCNQIDPQHSLPLFLTEFLNWLFTSLKSEMVNKTHEDGVLLYSPLPFYTKFMGDGLLVIWDVGDLSDHFMRNIILSCELICNAYSTSFYKKISGRVSYPPKVLRCGIARGTVLSVGDDNDYVGSCINLAARLQKTPGATFAFSRRGINIPDDVKSAFFGKAIVTVQTNVRGIGEAELICLRKAEYSAMSPEEKAALKTPGH